ncbi:AraC family transcriptional regulator [Calothrix sp. NIES-4071]|nr:AraC family transcriptional regulator [Calothrix sp. NIES-4071]BAZ60791.1 AraC family transcriptional regulator [Calothrix sp. NIES-4105]
MQVTVVIVAFIWKGAVFSFKHPTIIYLMAPETKPTATVPVIDYHSSPEASNLVLPKPAIHQITCKDWHFEIQRQPAHDTGEHRHNMNLVTMVTSKTPINQSIDGQTQRNLVGDNNLFILPAGLLHHCKWRQDIEFMCMGLDAHVFIRVGQELVNPDRIELIPHFATVEDPLIQGILLTIKDELITSGIGSNLFIDQLKATLVTHILRKYGVRKVQIATYADGLPRHKLNHVLDYIEANLNNSLGLEELAQQVGMSQFYFSRLFKQSLGITPHQYVIQQRVEQAKLLLQKGELGLAEIALECGFANQGHFNRHFKHLTGATPKEIARTYKNGKNI